MSKTTVLTCDFCGRHQADVALMISNQETGAAICEHCVRDASHQIMGQYIESSTQQRNAMKEARAAQAAAAAQGASNDLEHQPALPAPVIAEEPAPAA